MMVQLCSSETDEYFTNRLKKVGFARCQCVDKKAIQTLKVNRPSNRKFEQFDTVPARFVCESELWEVSGVCTT